MTKRELPKYCYRQRNGLYFQRRGYESVKVKSAFGSAEFWKEYTAYLEGKQRVVLEKRSFSQLIASYHRSHRYQKLMPRTARDYDKYTDFIEECLGALSPCHFERKNMIQMRDANAEKPYFANYLLAVMRVLMEHAIDLGWRKDNPCANVSKIEVKKKVTRLPWPQTLIDAFRACVPIGRRERLLMELCVGTGQRIGDVLDMTWDDVNFANGEIYVRQNKTGKVIFVPIVPRVQAVLEACSGRTGHILTNYQATGPWSYRGASDAIMKIRRKIGAEKFDIHSWRYNTATELVEAGCSDDLVASVTGQSMKMVAHYTRQSRQRVRAREAQGRRQKE